jgi:thioester reductase-like protein
LTAAPTTAPPARTTVLLTGATGMVGAEILARLIERDETHVIAVLRADDDAQAGLRLDALLRDVLAARPEERARVSAFAGDLCRRGLGLSATAREAILATVDTIVHSGASVAFDMPLEHARTVNVGGTAAVLSLARTLHERGRLRRFVHLSTAYVSGDTPRTFGEDECWVGQSFRNTYEQTKLEAELLLAPWAASLPLVVVRPSIVVGDARTGWTARFHGLYGPMRAFVRGLLERVPAAPDGLVDTVPLDYVAAAVVHLVDDAAPRGVLTLASGSEAVTVEELVGMAGAIAHRPMPQLVGGRAGGPGGTEVLVPYFDVRTRFDTRRAAETLAPAGLRPAPLAERIGPMLRYAADAGWGRAPRDRRAAARATLAAA